MDVDEVDKDYEVYKQLLDLWAKENPIKTNKLQVLLVVNGLLLTAVNMGGGFKATSWPIYIGGAVLCLVWVLSIGRTSLFQAAWQRKISELSQKYPSDHRFQILGTKDAIEKLPKFLRLVGGVSSKYYLIGAPILFGVGWLFVFLYFLLTGL